LDTEVVEMGKDEKNDAKKTAGMKPADDKAQQKKRLEGKMFGLLSKPADGDASGVKIKTREDGGDKPPAAGKEEGKKAAGVKAKDEKKPSGAKAGKEKEDAAAKDGKLAPDENLQEEGGDAGGEGAEGSEEKPSAASEKAKPNAKEKDDDKFPDSIPELQSQKEQIEELLSSIEDSYRDATLPENTYREIKEKNEKRLTDIVRKIESLGGTVEQKAPKAAAVSGDEAFGEGEAGYPAGAARQPAQGRRQPAGAGAAAPASQDMGSGKAEALIKLLEKKIEEKLKDVIATASVEVTDKRVRKMEERLEALDAGVKSKIDALDSELKSMKKTAESVEKYDKQFTSMNTEIEKVKALVDSVKEAKNVMDDKLQRVNENFAEIRSIVYQREAAGKEQTVLLDKLKDTVSQIDSARILREFTTRDEQLRDVNARLERLERSNKMLTETMAKIKGLLTDVGSLDNIVKASKHVGEKLEKMQELEEKMKATSTRLNSLFLDMKKKLDEFAEYRVRQDKLAGTGEDLVKNVEELTRRLTDYATKADVTGIRDELKLVREAAKSASSRPAQAAASGSSAEIAKLREEKDEIESLLETLEENYKAKAMGEDDYRKAKDNSIRKLADIERKMKQAASGGAHAGAGDDEGKYSRAMLLAKLRESYETGEITKQAYDRSMKLLLTKRQ
jgi:hypothetical protein